MGIVEIITTSEASIRLGCFLGVLLFMMAWELLSPRRPLTVSKSLRWSSNLGLAALNTVVVRLVMLTVAVTAVAAAYTAEERGWGLLNLVQWPRWIEIAIAVLLLDLVIYLQHVMFHAVPLFWRIHRVHHADLDLDATSGVRFHTLEILLSAFIKLAAVVLIGSAAVAVILFEVLLNATSLFNHSNVSIPLWFDRILRCLVVTPDMHRVHHSVEREETDSNFGFNFPWWDRLLGTYRPQPQAGHQQMTLGLPTPRDERQTERLPALLWMPFRGDQHVLEGDKVDSRAQP